MAISAKAAYLDSSPASRSSRMDATDSILPTAADYFNLNAFEPASAFNGFLYTGTGKAVTNIYGPSFKNLDIAFTKITKITEKVNFRFESNFFNAFNNHYFLATQGGNYGGPSVAFVTDVGTTSVDNPFGSWNWKHHAPAHHPVRRTNRVLAQFQLNLLNPAPPGHSPGGAFNRALQLNLAE